MVPCMLLDARPTGHDHHRWWWCVLPILAIGMVRPVEIVEPELNGEQVHV